MSSDMERIIQGIALLALLGVVWTCITTATTTAVCCPLLSTTSLPKRAPSNTSAFQQCTILQRVSSTCPTDGFVFCTTAPETNPTLMQIEFFNSAGTVVRNVTGGPPTLVVRVSCAQAGSTGTDNGFVVGSATN
ncbi:hypothetical protein TELCIR_01663 [Teladorsagia circumcincta]|uniref:C6 domain-containing protein n=1 Tax=Teladorsagia circumcincta TaxID=45464 RepID=A0A2G9V197_TELCI|nr:hypothetical protein TELCIR_01663 [Teladorsagia circumcincta]